MNTAAIDSSASTQKLYSAAHEIQTGLRPSMYVSAFTYKPVLYSPAMRSSRTPSTNGTRLR